MPTDDLDLEGAQQSPPGGEPTQNAPAEPGVQQNAAPSITPEQMAQMFQQASAQGNQPVLEALRTIQEALVNQSRPPEAPKDPSDLAERLLTDPEATIREQMDKWGRDNLARPLSRSLEVDRDERIETRAAEIDEEFGDGFFDKEIRPRLVGDKGVLSNWPINQQADPFIIDNAINGIMGNDFRDSEKRAVLHKALQETAKSKERDTMNAPHMMGPGRPRMRPTNALTPAMEYTLEGFQRAGISVTKEQIKDALTRENTLSAWTKPAQGAQK